MRTKLLEKENAIKLRKEGLSYSEILKQVPVARSSLNLWLRSVGLSKRQKQRLTQKKLESSRRGGIARKNNRIKIVENIKMSVSGDVGDISNRDLWLMGLMLYWAEGAKAKDYNPSVGIKFSNTDPKMINLFIKWCLTYLKISEEDIVFNIYLHESKVEESESVKCYWSEETGFNVSKFGKIYLKRNKIKPRRRNIGSNYFGLLQVIIKRSTNLNRKVAAWIEEICRQCGVV